MRAGHDGTPVTPARTTRRGFIALAAVTAVGVTASCAPGGAPAPRDPAPSALERRQVWAHMVPQGLPLAADPDVHYGSERPLSLAPAGTGYERLVADQLTQARAAGLTGMQILLLDGVNSGTDFVADWMSAADIVKDTANAELEQEVGFFLPIVGGVLLAVGGVLPAKK